MDKKTKKEKKLICKYDCGAYFDNTPLGKTQLMNHYQWDCPKNPNRSTRTTKRSEQNQQEMARNEPIPDESVALERIIREASQSRKIPAIVRMVKQYMDNPKKSLEVLTEAMRLADFQLPEMKLILWNWAQFIGISPHEILKEDIKEAHENKEEPKRVTREKLMYSTYSNSFWSFKSNDELILLFGQLPPSDDGEILTTRIYINKNCAKKIMRSLFGLLTEEKEENHGG